MLSIKLPKNVKGKPGEIRGFGFVEVPKGAAEEAIAKLSETLVAGRVIAVKHANK